MNKLLLLLFVLISTVGYTSNANKMSDFNYDSRGIDSLDLKINPLIDKKYFQNAAMLMFEKGKLLFGYGMYINASTVLEKAITTLNKVDSNKRDTVWSDTYVECLNWKGFSLSYLSDFDKALKCYITIEKYNSGKNDKYAAKAYNGMGIVFAMNNNNTLSEEYYKKALHYARNVEGFNLFPIYSNLGATFLAKRELDSAMIYFLDTHKMAVVQKDRNKEILSLQSLALVNSELGKEELAFRYYNEACNIALKDENYSQLSFLKYNIANYYLKLGDYSLAFRTANEALKLAMQTGSRSLEAKSFELLSKLCEEQKDYKKSLEYLRKSLSIKDSMFNNSNGDKLLRQKADFDLYRMQSERELIENGLALELANRKISNMITWFVVAILLVSLYVVGMGFRKQYKLNKNLSSQIEDIQTNDENLKEEIAIKSRDLTSISLLISKFNELSYLLGKKIKILKANMPPRSKDMEVVKEMEELISQFTSDYDGIEKFKRHYEQVPHEFYDKLELKYPDLTQGEKKLCALISMNLSTKEIAMLMDRSINTVEVAKSRIRKKMNVGTDVNLKDILG